MNDNWQSGGDFIDVSYINVKIGDFGIAKLLTRKHWDNYYTRTIAGNKMVMYQYLPTYILLTIEHMPDYHISLKSIQRQPSV